MTGIYWEMASVALVHRSLIHKEDQHFIYRGINVNSQKALRNRSQLEVKYKVNVSNVRSSTKQCFHKGKGVAF